MVVHDGKHAETIPDNWDRIKPDLVQVLANPPKDWPNAYIPQRPKFGKLVSVTRPGLNGTSTDLVPLLDWAVAEPSQAGGAVFFNPSLRLKYGDQLLAVYERGSMRIEIPREFLSTAQKITRAAAPPPAPRKISVYERLRQPNPFVNTDDDEDE